MKLLKKLRKKEKKIQEKLFKVKRKIRDELNKNSRFSGVLDCNGGKVFENNLVKVYHNSGGMGLVNPIRAVFLKDGIFWIGCDTPLSKYAGVDGWGIILVDPK